MKLWLWVLLCVIVIFSTIPVARVFQQYISKTIGREFFSYLVLFVTGGGLGVLLYAFIFKLNVKRVSQYLWLFFCAGLYVYFTLSLWRIPEEAIHFIEYGLLSYFLFRALNHRIHDRTIYLTSAFFVLLAGTTDEFLQWMMPKRFWDYRDVGFNVIAGGIFLLGIWKGVRPKTVYAPVMRFSVNLLAGIITVNLIFLGLCLSNTPSSVNRYTSVFKSLSWLRSEELMTEFGYRHKDPEIGIFYSRLTLNKLKETDRKNGKNSGKILFRELTAKSKYEELISTHTPLTDPFLYEFLVHLFRRDSNFYNLEETEDENKKIKMRNASFRENLILERYFGNTLKHSRFNWPEEKTRDLKKAISLWEEEYTSKAGLNFITFFSQKEALLVIFFALIAVWISGTVWKRRLRR